MKPNKPTLSNTGANTSNNLDNAQGNLEGPTRKRHTLGWVILSIIGVLVILFIALVIVLFIVTIPFFSSQRPTLPTLSLPSDYQITESNIQGVYLSCGSNSCPRTSTTYAVKPEKTYAAVIKDLEEAGLKQLGYQFEPYQDSLYVVGSDVFYKAPQKSACDVISLRTANLTNPVSSFSLVCNDSSIHSSPTNMIYELQPPFVKSPIASSSTVYTINGELDKNMILGLFDSQMKAQKFTKVPPSNKDRYPDIFEYVTASGDILECEVRGSIFPRSDLQLSVLIINDNYCEAR